MFFKLICDTRVSPLFSVICLIVLLAGYGLASDHPCPSRELRASLHPRMNNSSKIFCDCTTETHEVAWEIICFNDAHYSQPETAIDPENHQYAFLPFLFNIKYVYSSYVEINCNERSPKFQPAMFQGRSTITSRCVPASNLAVREAGSLELQAPSLTIPSIYIGVAF